MDFLISHTSKSINADLILPPSKSISNRALIIQALCQSKPTLLNLSQSSDTQSLVQALQTNFQNYRYWRCWYKYAISHGLP